MTIAVKVDLIGSTIYIGTAFSVRLLSPLRLDHIPDFCSDIRPAKAIGLRYSRSALSVGASEG
jgi:hypothetical protein